MTEAERLILAALETISEQQLTISNQLAEVLNVLTAEPETSLIEQLAELLQPLFTDMKTIKGALAIASQPDSAPASGRPTT
jgi:hypothetical protein